MKKTLYAIEFALIVLVFNIIPLVSSIIFFLSDKNDNTIKMDLNFGFSALIEIVIGIGLYVQCCWEKTPEHQYDISVKGFFKAFATGLFLFGSLLTINTSCGIISTILELCGVHDFAMKQDIIPPSSTVRTLIFIAVTGSAAMYEEVVYRLFLPEVMIKLFGNKLRLLWEAVALLLFVSGHFYLGITGMLNAFIAGAVLRIFFVKTKNIWINITVHSIYNLLLFWLAIMLPNVQELTS